MDAKRIQTLVEKYIEGTATPNEIAELHSWYRESNNRQMEWPEEKDAIRLRMLAHINEQTTARTRRLWPRMAAAASILIFLSAAGYLLLHRPRPQQAARNQDVSPFTANAILKTGHGKIILLDSAKKGLIARQDNITVNKTADGQIVYTSNHEQTTLVYDTVQVPAGGRPYLVKLSDGSKILLNAATQFRFPESFSATNRSMVELISGEIYADIVHNKIAPLQIKAPGQVATDVGTQFDINAYPDEAESRITLIEGSIKVTAHSEEKLLLPGQQTILTANSFTTAIADIDQVTAWKNGYFRFNGEHIDIIMRQLARWYNIEVAYEGKKTNEVFYGKITRKRNISEVLHLLEKTQKIHFKVEGRRVIVLSKS